MSDKPAGNTPPDFDFLNSPHVEESPPSTPHVIPAPTQIVSEPQQIIATESTPDAMKSSAAAVSSGGISGVNRRMFSIVAGYAIALTALIVLLLFTGRLSLLRNHTLESLPDLRPLDANEFQKIPEGTALPDGHVLRLNEPKRFGDVILTATKVTIEPLKFRGFMSGEESPSMTTEPVLKLWLKFDSVADGYAFPPYDSGLMAHRSPTDGQDTATLANSFLRIRSTGADRVVQDHRVLNFLHSPHSNFIIEDQNAAKPVLPGTSLTTFVACCEDFKSISVSDETSYRWRVHFRKGVNLKSGHGVTTLVDIDFTPSDISDSRSLLH